LGAAEPPFLIAYCVTRGASQFLKAFGVVAALEADGRADAFGEHLSTEHGTEDMPLTNTNQQAGKEEPTNLQQYVQTRCRADQSLPFTRRQMLDLRDRQPCPTTAVTNERRHGAPERDRKRARAAGVS